MPQLDRARKNSLDFRFREHRNGDFRLGHHQETPIEAVGKNRYGNNLGGSNHTGGRGNDN